MNIVGRGGMTLNINNLSFDMNADNQGTPDPETEFQQARALSILSDGVSAISRINISNLDFLNLIGDGVTFRGTNEQDETFGDIYVSDVSESQREYNRSTVTFVAPFNYAEVRDCPSIDSIEVELNYHVEGTQNTMHVENVTVARQLDINFKNPLFEWPQFTGRNITAAGRINFLAGDYDIRDFAFTVSTAQWRMSPGDLYFEDGSVIFADGLSDITGTANNQGFIRPAGQSGYTLTFKDVDFVNNDVNSPYIFSDENQLLEGQEVVFENCTFDSNCRIFVRSGRFTFRGCTINWNSVTEAFVEGGTRSGDVTNVYTFENNTAPNAYLISPLSGGANEPYTIVASGNTTLGVEL
jgi:hypothetical protein